MSSSTVTCILFPCGKSRMDIRALQSLQMQTVAPQISICPLYGEMEHFSMKYPLQRIVEPFDKYLRTLKTGYLTLLFSPDYFISPDSISRQITALDANPDADVCRAGCIAEPVHGDANNGSRCLVRKDPSGIVFRSIVAQNISERFPGMLETGDATEILAMGGYAVMNLDIPRIISLEEMGKQG